MTGMPVTTKEKEIRTPIGRHLLAMHDQTRNILYFRNGDKMTSFPVPLEGIEFTHARKNSPPETVYIPYHS